MSTDNSPSLLKVFFERSPVSMQSLNENGQFISVNPHWCKVLGYSKEEAVGAYFGDFLVEEDRIKFQENFSRFKDSGFVCDVSFRMKRKDGVIIPVAYDGNIHKDPITGEIQTICIFKDLTQTLEKRQQAQKALVDSEKRFRELQDNIEIGIFRISLEGRFEYANHALMKMLRVEKPSDLIGSSSMDIYVNPSDREDLLKKLHVNKENKISYEVQFKRFDGTSFWARLHVKALRDEDDKVLFRDGTVEDISLFKSAESDMLGAKNKAENADRLKSTFLANMSHEIRTPMNAILGFSELLLDPDIPNEQKADFSRLINNNGNILMNLIDDIIDISKIEAGETQIRMGICQVYPILSDLQLQFDQKLEHLHKSVQLKLEVENHLKTMSILSDSFRLRQILTNLLDNALKFTSEGEIKYGLELIQSSSGQELLCLFVEDTGIGIQKDMLDVIFEQFRQVDESPTRKFGGTGLGLYICKKLVGLMNGEIRVQSEHGKGARFEVLLKTTK